MIHPVAKVGAALLGLAGLALSATVVVDPGDDPLNVLAIPVILVGTLLAVAVVLLAGLVARALRELLGQGEASPPD